MAGQTKEKSCYEVLKLCVQDRCATCAAMGMIVVQLINFCIFVVRGYSVHVLVHTKRLSGQQRCDSVLELSVFLCDVLKAIVALGCDSYQDFACLRKDQNVDAKVKKGAFFPNFSDDDRKLK